MTEIWKKVPSVPGLLASSLGRITAEPHYGPMPRGGVRLYKTKPTYGTWRKDTKSFTFIRQHGGKTKTRLVAPLVCEAFHGPKPKGHNIVCMHKDENSRNNRPENLKWGTQKENLNCPGFLEYCRSRTGDKSPAIEWHRKMEKRRDEQTKMVQQFSGLSQRKIAVKLAWSKSKVDRVQSYTRKPGSSKTAREETRRECISLMAAL